MQRLENTGSRRRRSQTRKVMRPAEGRAALARYRVSALAGHRTEEENNMEPPRPSILGATVRGCGAS